MKTSINIIILIFLLTYPVLSQEIKKRELQQVIDYYPNGKIKAIKNLVLGKCSMFVEEFGDYIILDTCYYGLFKEYYPNGVLKILGQYDCKFWDKNYKLQDTKSSFNLQNDSFKVGIWQEFDSLGKQTKISFYDDKGYLVFDKYPLKKDTLEARESYVMLKLDKYETKNSYLIKRHKNNKHLFLKFLQYSDHNYWSLYQKPTSILIDKEIRYKGEQGNGLRFIKGIKSDDIGGNNNKEFMDISDLNSGIYYLQYKYSPMMLYNYAGLYFYEIEIILEDLNE